MVRGMQEVLKWLGGRKEWNNELEEMLKVKLEEQGLGKKKEKIDAQMKIALEAYTLPASEERKIITAQKGGLQGYLELCKHHDLRTDASANRLRSEIMELGKPCRSRKEVREEEMGKRMRTRKRKRNGRGRGRGGGEEEERR